MEGPGERFAAVLGAFQTSAEADLAAAEGLPAENEGVVGGGMSAAGTGVEPGDGGGAEVRPGFPDPVGMEGEGAGLTGWGAIIRHVEDLPVTRQAGLVFSGVNTGEPAEAGFDFAVGGWAAVDALVDPVQALAGILEGGEFGMGGEFLGLAEDERAIEEPECLLGDGGFRAAGGVVVGVGEIEGDQGGGQREAVDEGVEAAPGIGGGEIEQDRAAADCGGIERAGTEEEAVAHDFEVEPAALPFPEAGIGLVDGVVGGRSMGIEPEGVGGEDEAVEGFQGRTGSDEAEGEIIEQREEGGSGFLWAEIAGVGERRAEMPGPDAVDDDAGGEGIGGSEIFRARARRGGSSSGKGPPPRKLSQWRWNSGPGAAGSPRW